MNEFNTVAKLQTETIEVISKQMQTNLRKNKSVASGNLLRSINTEKTKERQGDLETALEIKAWYAELVDEGIDNRGPGKQPPVRPIQQWLQRKSISIPSGVTIEQYSFAIAKKIAKQGQKKRAYPFIKPSTNAGETYFENRIEDAIGVDVEIDVNVILESSPYLKKV